MRGRSRQVLARALATAHCDFTQAELQRGFDFSAPACPAAGG